MLRGTPPLLRTTGVSNPEFPDRPEITWGTALKYRFQEILRGRPRVGFPREFEHWTNSLWAAPVFSLVTTYTNLHGIQAKLFGPLKGRSNPLSTPRPSPLAQGEPAPLPASLAPLQRSCPFNAAGPAPGAGVYPQGPWQRLPAQVEGGPRSSLGGQ